MNPTVHLSRVRFSDGSDLAASAGDVVVVVGPNNSGKSQALRGIRALLENKDTENPVVLEVETTLSGSADDLVEWLERSTRRSDNPPGNPRYSAHGANVHKNQARQAWTGRGSVDGLARFFCHLLTADERLSAGNPASAIRLTQDPLTHPIHFLQRDDSLELRISKQFRRAFDVDLIVHRNAGANVPLYLGDRPEVLSGEDRVSYSYSQRLEELTELSLQGDGIRSFAGVLLHAFTGSESILLIDEPEAFLHPPQARQLGRTLVEDKRDDRQIFVATHSSDVLRGMLDSGAGSVRVLRITRSSKVNEVKHLNSTQVAELWKDPLLRYSEILDGLFHERVLVAESDSDCRFYEAVLDAITEEDEQASPDILFAHCGGKGRIPVVARALTRVGVPVTVVADFDVLNSDRPLRDIVEALGGTWANVAKDWKVVTTAVSSKKPEKSVEEITIEIKAVLAGVTESTLPAQARHDISAILKQSTPWAIAKAVGKSYVPSGDPTQSCNRLLEALQAIGLFVVPVGELESFVKSIGSHGPGWVARVLEEKDVKSDLELSDARAFMKAILERHRAGKETQLEQPG